MTFGGIREDIKYYIRKGEANRVAIYAFMFANGQFYHRKSSFEFIVYIIRDIT